MMWREPWRTRLLFASFAANLFLAGLLVMRDIGHHGGPPGSDAFIARMTSGMPTADAERFARVMHAARPQNEQARAAMEAARAALSQAIGQSPFDEQRVRAAMTAWQQRWRAWSDVLGISMLDAARELSPEGRRSLAQAGRRHGAAP